MTHVEEDRLLAFTLGQLEGDAARDIEGHLAACADCKKRQEALSSVAFSKTAVGSSKDGQPTRVEGTTGTGTGLTLQRGATLGRYVLLEKLGAGGMGEVFAAYDPQLDRKVAVKLLRSGALSAEEGKQRLVREAQAMARLQHPNVIAVHDVGVFSERVFIAMEYVQGETLADWFRGMRTWKEVVRIFLQAGSGLAAAHRAGLVHRDFKPDNVLLGEDLRPRVVDFGLARQSSATPAPQSPEKAFADVVMDSSLAVPLTRDGAVMGTPGYMAPEQIAGLATDARSDQFSFCVALWEGLFGKRPFSGSTLKQHAQEIAAARFNPVASDQKVPSWVVDVVKKGLAANPVDRWPDMDALLKELRPRAQRSPRRILFIAGLVVFSVFSIGYGVWTRQRLLVCGGTEQRLNGIWDPARKAKLRAGFVGTGLSYASDAWTNSERALDAWAAEWVVTSRDVCEASKLRKVDSTELTALKSACLDERLQRLEALVGLFDSPDHDVVNNAPTAARDLERASSCSVSTGLRRVVVDEKEKAAEQVLRVKLAEARAFFAAGKYAAGAARLKQGLDPAAPPVSQSEAYLWLARLELKRGEPRLAHLANLTAAEQAIKGGEAGLAAKAFSRLYSNEGYDEGDADADAWNRLATAAAARAPGDWDVQIELSLNDGFVDLRRKRFKAALADFELVLSLRREHLGAEHPDVASTLNNLGVVLSRLDRIDEAVARYEESLSLHEKVEGLEHPNVALALHNLAVALKRMGRSIEARAMFERAIAVRRKALGFNHVDTLRSAQSLVQLLIQMGELEPARVLLDEVRETRALMFGADSPEQLPVIELEAELYLAGEYWREALQSATHHLTLGKARGAAGVKDVDLAMIEQAIAWTQLGQWGEARKNVAEIQRRVALGDDVDDALLAECLARIELSQGHAALAVPMLEKAVALREKNGPIASARLRLLLAHSLVDSEQAEKSIAVLTDAETTFSQAQSMRLLLDAQVLKAQATWLAREAERSAAVELLRSLAPQLGEPQRAALNEWVGKHGVSLDAGIP